MFTEGDIFERREMHKVVGGNMVKGISVSRIHPIIMLFPNRNSKYARINKFYDLDDKEIDIDSDVKDVHRILYSGEGEVLPGYEMRMQGGNEELRRACDEELDDEGYYKEVYVFVEHRIEDVDKKLTRCIGKFNVSGYKQQYSYKNDKDEDIKIILFTLEKVYEEDRKNYFIESRSGDEIRIIPMEKKSYYLRELHNYNGENYSNETYEDINFGELENAIRNSTLVSGNIFSLEDGLPIIDSRREKFEEETSIYLSKAIDERNDNYPQDIDYSNKRFKGFSYHVNVGCALASIVLIEEITMGCNPRLKEVWLIDAGVEKKSVKAKMSANNILHAIEDIKAEYKLDKFEFDKIFISHAHYDHISEIEDIGISNLKANGEIWVNYFYIYKSVTYNNIKTILRKRMYKGKPFKVLLPIYSNSRAHLDVMYPVGIKTSKKSHIYKKAKKAGGLRKRINGKFVMLPVKNVSKVNNSSSILNVNIGGKQMIFPGDVEKQGWNELDCSFNKCIQFIDYGVVPHHGSINGYKLKKTCNNSGAVVEEIKNCVNGKKKKYILSTKKGVHTGIPSKEVKSGIEGKINDVYSTEKKSPTGRDLSYYKLDWATGDIDTIWCK